MYLDSLTRTEEHKNILCFALKILSFILNLKKYIETIIAFKECPFLIMWGKKPYF